MTRENVLVIETYYIVIAINILRFDKKKSIVAQN